jgi:hypothetical protein
MLIVNYYRSADPVVRLLKQGRSVVRERPYAGYLLFLFGSGTGDEGIATWFARNLIALDSLTGSSLAGLVFAERVKIRAQAEAASTGSTPREEEVSLDRVSVDLGFDVRRLVSRRGEVSYRPEEELTAITYGADSVVRELGLQSDDLPCIAILDALPTEDNIDVLHLRDYDPKEIIHVLRELAAKFTRQEKFQPFFDLMELMHSCCDEIDSLGRQISDLRRKRAAIPSKPPPAELWPERARAAFMAGRHREFRSIIKTAPEMPGEEKQRILTRLEADAPKIVELSRTISALQYYRSKFDALDFESTQRLRRIIETHVCPYLPEVPASALDDQQLQDMGARLLALKRTLELEYARNLPDVAELITQFEGSLRQQTQPIEENLLRKEADLKLKREQLENYQLELLRCEVPRLQHTFSRIAIAHGIALNSRKSGGGLVRWLSGFLKPDILLKLGEMVAKHYAK